MYELEIYFFFFFEKIAFKIWIKQNNTTSLLKSQIINKS